MPTYPAKPQLRQAVPPDQLAVIDSLRSSSCPACSADKPRGRPLCTYCLNRLDTPTRLALLDIVPVHYIELFDAVLERLADQGGSRRGGTPPCLPSFPLPPSPLSSIPSRPPSSAQRPGGGR